MLYILKELSSRKGINLALNDNDARVVLIEDGVYLDISPLKGKAKIYALRKDLESRGLLDKLVGIEIIDYSDLVDLIEENRVVNI